MLLRQRSPLAGTRRIGVVSTASTVLHFWHRNWKDPHSSSLIVFLISLHSEDLHQGEKQRWYVFCRERIVANQSSIAKSAVISISILSSIYVTQTHLNPKYMAVSMHVINLFLFFFFEVSNATDFFSISTKGIDEALL